MDESTPATPAPVSSPKDRLDSWKEIAAYFGRDVSTVQRWEKREGMPIHRHLHQRMGSVYAFRKDLEVWARTRNLTPVKGTENEVQPPIPFSSRIAPLEQWTLKKRALFLLLAAALALGMVLLLRFEIQDWFWRNPIADARFQRLTDFDGAEQSAAVSRDGQFVAFLSNRDGRLGYAGRLGAVS
jgi:hypothetical protein